MLGVGAYLYIDYSAREAARGAAAVVEFGLQRITDAMRPFTEADYVGRYDAAHASFTFRSGQQHDTTSTLTEPELPSFIRSATPAAPKLVIIYEAADFPVPADKAAFESRVRSTLESAGASVTFAATSPAQSQSLFP
jgi:hypothetical protein